MEISRSVQEKTYRKGEDTMKNYVALVMLLMLVACGGIENEKIDTQNEVKQNKLLIPPCSK